MQFFKQLTDPALKRLYKFVLKRLIGRFLAEDEIDLDQLDVHLRSGRLELCDLLLNADVLNSEICEAHALPFRVKKGYLGSVRVTISYMNIMSESCLVEIDDIEIVLVPVGEETGSQGETNTCTTSPTGDFKKDGNSTPHQAAETTARESSNDYTDEVSQEGLDFVASWIEQVTSKIKVTLSNICLRLETCDKASEKNVALLCKLEWAQFTDESASEVASVYGKGGMDQSFGSSSQSMYQSMAASSVFGISQKAVKFRGISLDLLLPSDELEDDDSGSDLHHFMASDSSRQCYVQLKLSHYEALEAPAVDADLFLHSVRIVLQPQHFYHFGTLLDAFTNEPPPKSTKDRYATPGSLHASICESKPAWLEQDDRDESSEGGVKLSLREFQRIEQLLLQYHKTHEELANTQRDRGPHSAASYEHADFPYPVPRRLSSAESVESVGLSDLEDEENFFECDPGAESLAGSAKFGRASSMMAQSMYASALYDPEETTPAVGEAKASGSLRASVRHRPSRSVRSRVKVHLLECDIVILYDDLLDHGEDEHDGADYSSESRRQKQLRRRRRGLPIITDQERIEVSIKDVILSTLVYQSHTTLALSVGTFEVVEKMLARMSTEIDEDDDALLSISVLRFEDVSPATNRKVHLSANMSAQCRIDMNADGGVNLLAVQISAQPILLEWDMHIIDRAHRLMKLMEDSSVAKQKKAANSTAAPEALYPKKMDLNTECVEITLRFPLVNSDLIRFGPSSKRGLSEDKLVLMLEGVKASSYADGAESESVFPMSSKPKLAWLSQFDIRFDSISASLVGPVGGNQRNSEFKKHAIIGGRSDMTSGDSCSLRLRMQVPTNEEIRSALTAKQNISQDSLEQFIEAATNLASDEEEKSGDDNDGGRVGSNGWSQDARKRAQDFEVAASAAALIDLEIRIPHSKLVFNKQSFDRLMILFDALLMINPIDVNGHNQMMVTAAYRSRLIPSYMTVDVELNDGTLQLEYAPPATVVEPTPPIACVYHIAFQDFRVFQVSQWMGQLVSRVHVAAQNITLLEEDKHSKVTSPVLYKNPIGVNEAPVLFVGIDIVDQTQEMREMKVELHVSQVNMRYDVSSKWMFYLSELLLLEYPPPIIPLDSASTTENEYVEILQQIQAKSYETVHLAVPPKTVFTKLFVSFYDAVVDYSPTTLSSRVMLVLGNVTVSSNVVTGALIQGYKISLRDIQLYLTPERPTYDEIDDNLLGNELLAASNKHRKHAVVSFAGEARSRGQLSALYPSQLMFFEKHGFLQMVTVDCIDIFLRAIVPPVEDNAFMMSAERKVSTLSLGAPELSVELTLGTANIYACFDSFNTLIELISTWTEQLSTEGEPRDTTAYVGLDRVKDVSSVSVVTNLGPATVRSSRPSIDESLSQTPPLTSARLAAQNTLRNDPDLQRTSQYSRTMSMTSKTASSGVNLFAQLDENAFGSSRRVFSGNHATTDTEARLLRTRLDEIQKEKHRMVSGPSPFMDDTLSAAELRRKYNKQDEEPARPKIRINELFIEDYYPGNGKKSEDRGGMSSGAGDFLMAPRTDSPVLPAALADEDPWFSSRTNNSPAIQTESHPVGSLPDEHSARWLGPSAFGDSVGASSPASSHRFDPVDEDVFARELKPPATSQYNRNIVRDEEDEDDEFPEAAFPAGPKNWWGMESPQDVELSELQTEETESAFSHHLPFLDDESTQDVENDRPHPLSMSMMIGNGEDEGTEVELDFTLDREMQTKFNRLMDVDSSDGKDIEDLDDDVDEELSEANFHYEHHGTTMLGARRPSKAELTAPVPISPSRRSFSEHSSHSGATSAIPSLFSPPDEPTARWFYDDVGGDSAQREGPPSRIYPHHVEIPIGGTAASLSFGEREYDEAIRSVAREGAVTKTPVTTPVVIRHVLLRDFNICMRFFGGSDWSKDLVNVPTLSRRGTASTTAVVPEARAHENTSATKNRKEKLLDALLDNYVPTAEIGLFGAESTETSAFSGSSRPRIGGRIDTDRSSFNSSATSRKRSLKSGRKTEEMLELVVTRIQLRLDIFNDDESQPLASNTVLALGDIEILDYISTSQIRKIICYWKSDASHPRESGSSMVHVHLMTVRPGPNLCEEHRLKMRMLPLRVNLDQEVVNFLRQFVPTEVGGRHPGTASHAAADEQDDDDGVGEDPDGTELSSMAAPTPNSVTETDLSLGVWFFQSIDIRPCKIKIDYRPNRVDFEALRAGDYLEVINLFVLEGMELVLRRVKASGVDGWAALGEHMLMSWVNDISRHQIHKCVASVSMPPLRPFANIGSGAADLILLPLEHYGRDRRVVRGIKKGAKSFLKSVTIETLNTASKVAQGTQALLEHADDVVSSTTARKRHIKYRQPGSRIARNSKSMGGGGIRSAQDRGGIGSRQYLAQQPSNATEGLYQAYDSLSRELHVAAKTIVAVPLIEYKKTGSQGYVRSVIRAVPVAVLRPMIGASEAVSKALIGVRNAMDPEMKEDVENKFKDFRTI